MKVLFDIGNSQIKWAWFEQSQNSFKEPFSLHSIGRENHAECSIGQIASTHWCNWPQPAQVVVSSVAADEEHWRQLRDWCVRHWQQTPLRVTSSAEGYGIRNAYAQAENLGSDRWAAIIGAHHLRHTDTCVIDCGTAITVDFLDAAGHHLGGYITPGLGLMQQSLAQRTDAIQLLLQPEEFKIGQGCSCEPGKSTEACIQHGLLMATSGLIEKACRKMEIQTGKLFHCLLTGGNAKWLVSCLAGAVELEPHLVFLGLAQIASEDHTSRITNRDITKR